MAVYAVEASFLLSVYVRCLYSPNSLTSPRPPFAPPMQSYSPRVRSPLCSIDTNAPAADEVVFKKPTAPAPRLARPDSGRERSGSSAGICTLPSRLTRSASSIEQAVQSSETRRARNALQMASNAVPLPAFAPGAGYPASPSITPAVTAVAPFSLPCSTFNMTALDENLPRATGVQKTAAPAAALTTPAPESPPEHSAMDFEKIPVFPTVTNSEVPDFPCLSPDTVRSTCSTGFAHVGSKLADLIRGKIATHITRVVLVDCRFEYEYKGGHIQSAVNLHTEELVDRTFCRSVPQGAENLAIIFYCEFSSYRGPRLCRFLRAWDRKMNLERYPRLHYENLFVLKGGYKGFWSAHPDLCDPQGSYLPMSDPRFAEQCSAGLASCKKQRPTRSYSWSGLSQPMF